MIVPAHYVTKESTFERLHADVEAVVRTDARLPTVPFKDPLVSRGFEEFDWAMSGGFWPFLQGLALLSSDQTGVFAVLEPEPVQYFRAEFGYYNWATLPVSLSRDAYWRFLNDGPASSPADSMVANARTVVFTVPSKQWAIWGERDCEICVLATRNGEPFAQRNDIDWVAGLGSITSWKEFVGEIARNFKFSLSGRHQHKSD